MIVRLTRFYLEIGHIGELFHASNSGFSSLIRRLRRLEAQFSKPYECGNY